MLMDVICNPWVWGSAYLVIGLVVSTCAYVQELLTRRNGEKAPRLPPFFGENKPIPNEAGWSGEVVAFLALTVIWLPAWIYFTVSEWLGRNREAKEKARRESPVGKAESESQYREDIEREIKPWISPEDLTRRNVPWSEFDADYQEFKNLFQRDRDIFEALIAKVQPGDEIACFSTHEETWKRMFGRAGWAIVRDGKVIAQLTTIMN